MNRITLKPKNFLFLIFGLILYSSYQMNSQSAFYNLPDSERIILYGDQDTSALFLCSQDQKRVFGKNSANIKDCYAIGGNSIGDLLGEFMVSQHSTEKQVGFYTQDSRQIHPAWIEPKGEESFLILSFVLTREKVWFVQALRKRDKQYFYFKTKKDSWK